MAEIETRELGDTGIDVSIIGLGGGQFAGSEHMVEEIREIFQTALDNGVNFIDTARDYGEERIGEALKDIDDDYYISSKTLAKNKKDVLNDVKESLKELNQSCIDFYFMHNPMDVDDYKNRKNNGVLEALQEVKDGELVGNIGVSCDYIEPLKIAIEDEIDVIMTHYNVGNTLSEDVINRAHERNIGVLAAKSFAGGILVDPKAEVEQPRENKMTPSKALNYILSNKNISSALVGARYSWQIEECAEVGKNFHSKKVNREEIKESVFSFLGTNFCRDCRYCWPYEELGYDFDISEILRFLDRYEKYKFKRFPRIEFSKLPYKDKLSEIEKYNFDCPFDINIVKRLKDAEKKLDLKIPKEKWIEKLEMNDKISTKTFEKIKSLEASDAIEKLHTELIPSGVIEESVGILLIQGLYSFGYKDAVETFKNTL